LFFSLQSSEVSAATLRVISSVEILVSYLSHRAFDSIDDLFVASLVLADFVRLLSSYPPKPSPPVLLSDSKISRLLSTDWKRLRCSSRLGFVRRFNLVSSNSLLSLSLDASADFIFSSSATFQLTTNYRSHGGICDAADALIKVIRALFPNSIDHLEPEKGLVQGPRPLFLPQRSESIKEIFSSSEGTSEIEFGAHQCEFSPRLGSSSFDTPMILTSLLPGILVRSEKTRDELREKLGKDAGLIMTISESKGSFSENSTLFLLRSLTFFLLFPLQVWSSRMWSYTTSSTTQLRRNRNGESSSRMFPTRRLLDSMSRNIVSFRPLFIASLRF